MNLHRDCCSGANRHVVPISAQYSQTLMLSALFCGKSLTEPSSVNCFPHRLCSAVDYSTNILTKIKKAHLQNELPLVANN